MSSSTTTVFDYVSQTPLSIAIAALYIIFFWRLADHVTEATVLAKKEQKARDAEYRRNNNHVSFSVDSGEEEEAECDTDETSKSLKAKVEAAEFKKHAILIGSGVVGICVSASLANRNVQTGLGWGSVMCIFAAIAIQWRNYRDTHKLCICGGGLAALVAFAITQLPDQPQGRSVTEPI